MQIHFFKNNKIKEKKTGFTLIETLISITILMISIAAPLSLAGQGLIAANIAQKQIIAFYLAQDAIETIINIKISNRLDLNRMLTGLNNCKVINFSNNSACIIDTATKSLARCAPISDCKRRGIMYKNPNTGFYNHTPTNGNSSGFIRFVKVRTTAVSNPGSIDEEAEIEVTVQWLGPNGQDQEYVLNTRLANW